MERTLAEIRKQIIMAGALGDAFGYAVEFDSWNRIKSAYGATGLQHLVISESTQKAEASDDTQMTLFAMQAIIYSLQNNELDNASIVSQTRWAYQQWYETQLSAHVYTSHGITGPHIPHSMFQNEPVMFQRQAPGNTCMSAMSLGGFGSITTPINDSKGCGAVMRAAPFAFLHPLKSLDDVWYLAAAQGAFTHGHVEGWASGAALAYILARILKGETLTLALLPTLSKLEGVKATNTSDLLRKAIALSRLQIALTPDELSTELGEGWTGDEALAIAVYSALRGTSVIDAIKIATNHDGDSDSTASIAGQLAASVHPLTADEMLDVTFVDLGPLATNTVNKLNESLDEFTIGAQTTP